MRYKFYIDFTSGEGTEYVQAYPETIEPFVLKVKEPSEQIDEYFYRVEWGKLRFRNRPKEFKQTNNNIYRLYSILDDINFPFSRKIFVKYIIEGKFTCVGYFGRNDFKYDYDRKIITVTPTVIDKYTPIFEWDKTEINFKDWNFTEGEITIVIDESSLKMMQDWPWLDIFASNSLGMVYTTPKNMVKENDYDDAGNLGAYFDGAKPKEALFDDVYWGFACTHKVYTMDGFDGYSSYNLRQRVDILGQKVTPENRLTVPDVYGDYELSLFRIYEGTRVGGLSGNRYRQLYCQTQFSREELIKIDEADIESDWGFVSPIGAGWHMRGSRVKNGKNAHLWTRLPFNGAYSNTWEVQVDVINTAASSYDWNWYRYRETKLKYDTSTNSFNFISGIKLRSFVEHILNTMSTETATMSFKSTFFFNDFESELSILKNTSGYNYVDGKINILNGLMLMFTKDLTEQDENTRKSMPTITLEKFLNDLNKVFANTLVWFIDDLGNFRIEHKKYMDLTRQAMNLIGNPSLNFTTQWNYDKKQMFAELYFNQINAGYIDFTNNVVKFDRVVSNNRNSNDKHESETELISTDAKFCVLNPNELREGLILLAVDENNVVRNKPGFISNLEETNGYLAISNILYEYGRYEGVWHVGEVNSVMSNFTTTQRNKIGIELSLSGRKESLFYVTQIGLGMLDNGRIDFENENTKITLRYRYNSAVTGDVFALVYQKSTDEVLGARNVWADIDNYSVNN